MSRKTKNFYSFAENTVINNDIENGNYTILGPTYSNYVVAVSKRTDKTFKKKILAAIISQTMGIKSIDYVLKHYLSEWKDEKLQREEILLNKILHSLTDELEEFSKNILNAHEKSPDVLGFLAADAALCRCQASFHAIAYLLRRGFAIEAIVLCRTILEQIAWALSIS